VGILGGPDDSAPITLIVTIFNALQDLPTLLTGISGQTLLPSEVLIVDRGSTDGTVELLWGWQPPAGPTVKIIQLNGTSLAGARNFAIENAGFEYLAVLDGAVNLHSEWLARLWSALMEGAQVALGSVHPTGRTLLERTIGRVEVPLANEVVPPAYPTAAGAIAFVRSSWDAVGGYPEWLQAGQDKVFAVTLRQANVVPRFVPEAIVEWNPRQTLSGYLAGSYQEARAVGAARIMDRASMLRCLSYLSAAGALVVFRHSALIKLSLLVAAFIRLRPHLLGVWLTRGDNPDRLWHRAVSTTVVVLVGDVVKVAGYQRGWMVGFRAGDG